ncbi:MAG: phosphatidate cytidylyltransferase, partial [Mesorhizobium sp.]
MHETLILVVGLTAVLTSASLVAGILSWRAPKPLSSTLVNLNQRINAWWVMVVAITVAFFFGRSGMTILFALI